MKMTNSNSPPVRTFQLATIEDLLTNSDEGGGDWIVKPLLRPEGRLILAGPPKVGKSMFTLQLALHVAAGRDFLMFSVPLARRVLVIQLEISKASFQERLKLMVSAISSQDVSANTRFNKTFNWRLNNIEDANALIAVAREFAPELIILDPLYKLHSKDENKASELAEITNLIDLIAVSLKAAVILVHHLRKEQNQAPSSGISEMRGSSHLGAWPDATAILKSLGKNTISLHLDLRDGPAPDDLALTLDTKTLFFKITAEPDDSKVTDAAVTEALTTAGGQAALIDLKKLLKEKTTATDRTIERKLATLEADGVIKKLPPAEGDKRQKVVVLVTK